MTMKVVFEDGENIEMDCFLNTHGKISIGVGESDSQSLSKVYITLNKADVKKLIKILSDYAKDMVD